jgi:hypothetical protein
LSVILDTNQLPQNGDPSALSLQVLKAVVSENGKRLAAPELVLVEWESKVRRDAETTWRQARVALDGAGRICQVPELPDLDAAALAAGRRQQLEELVEVLPMPGDCWEEALRREANRVPPTRDGKGARDAAIWLAALEHARAEGPSFLVTKNTKDFADPADKDRLHPHLVAEMATPPSIELVTSTEDVLGRLAAPNDATVGVDGLSAMPAAESAVIKSIDGEILDSLALPDLGDGSGRYVAGPVSTAVTAVQDERRFEIDGQRVAFVSGMYRVRAPVGALKRAAGRGMSELQTDAVFDVPVRLWVRGSGAEAQAEIVSIGTPATL